MSAKSKSVFLTSACAVACLMFLASATTSGPLVFRDDFICYDTLNSLNFEANNGNDVCLDGSGFFSQINKTRIAGDEWDGIWGYQYNKFDATGNQVRPVTVFMPDQVSENFAWYPNARLYCFGNDFGAAAVVGAVENRAGLALQGNVTAFLFNRSGWWQGHALCFDSDFAYSFPHWVNFASGAINEAGVVGAVWSVYNATWTQFDSLYARLYYPDKDSFGPLISVYELPAPLDATLTREWPRIGVADDGSCVVAWMSDRSCRAFYVVFNPDGTARCEVQLVYPDIEGVNPIYRAPRHIDVAIEADGDFYIAWFAKSYGASSVSPCQVLARGFNADGTPKYDPMRIMDTDSNWVPSDEWARPTIDCDDSGNVLVAWSDARDFPGNHDRGQTPRNVYVQKIDPEGNLVGPNYRINNNLGAVDHYGEGSMCDINNAGQAVILWQNTTLPYRVSAQLMPYHDIGTFVPGDLNLDFKGNISDLVYLSTYLFSGKADSMNFWPKSLADFNGDGKNGNISDVCYMVSYLFGTPTGPAPHTPYDGIREPLPIWPGPIGSPTKGVILDEE